MNIEIQHNAKDSQYELYFDEKMVLDYPYEDAFSKTLAEAKILNAKLGATMALSYNSVDIMNRKRSRSILKG